MKSCFANAIDDTVIEPMSVELFDIFFSSKTLYDQGVRVGGQTPMADQYPLKDKDCISAVLVAFRSTNGIFRI